ncbi:MAG: 50S ribosomal protein L10 [Bacteroidia bacterium]|nr:50S ribosomal protein L10 [Bacteroidia bacterium]MCZ2247492.1 50S ribosomal protein L10 [Bacteroidia bacterium]
MKTREDKEQLINELVTDLQNNPNFYITDTSTLTVEKTNALRKACFKNNITLKVVKNTLLQKAMLRSEKNYEELFSVLKGTSAVMFCEVGNVPAKLIKEFRAKNDRPILKAAYVEECSYIGDNQLETLANIKSKNELIGEIIGLLQSPAKNVISALKSGGGKIAGIVKTLSEKPE